ncbi:MFS transporter [Hespellia stercorisuis]|uniref:MFS transporter, DHA3 family, macrolide efflux protein n=1 Tax=Hespellia stercorisuis DSM 15480 TaxID=1121950 RepID=A0A1M6SHB2_9FIRM|nr:MFS transporter [Hespellia stercorisuis]SHK44105.1 MFS transporter, DHA3 family, macrolide efflux protein [Hespellia stercorisuis DSM 15480]
MKKTQKWKSQFIVVALGQAISMLGSHGVQFALIWWLAEKTSSPLMLGIAGIVAYLPMSIFSPLAGIAADRYNRKFISIFSDMAMGVAALIYAVLLFFFDLPVWTVFVMLCVRGIGSTFQQPAIQSIIPQLVPKDQLVKTNGWMQLLNSGSFLLGPVIGAALYAIFPMSVVLMSDVVGAILASAALAVVRIPELAKTKDEKQHFVTEIKEGLQVFKEDKKLFYIIIAEALCMFFYAPLSSFYPLMTSDYFNLPAMYGSAVELSFAIGMMISALLFSSILKVERKIRVSFIGLFGMGAASFVCGVIPPAYVGWFFFAAVCICLGAAGNVHTIPLTAYMQETIAPEKMGRAFSVLTLISSVTMPVGLLFSSPIAEKVGVNVWFLVSGFCMIILTTFVFIYYILKHGVKG